MNEKRKYMDILLKFLKIYFKRNHQINANWLGKNNGEILNRDAYTKLNSENER